MRNKALLKCHPFTEHDKITPATFVNDQSSPLYFTLPPSLTLYSTVSFTPSQRSIWPDNMMAGFPKGRWAATVACHLATVSLFHFLRLQHRSWILKIKKKKRGKKNIKLLWKPWPFQKKKKLPTLWLPLDIYTTHSWWRNSLTFWDICPFVFLFSFHQSACESLYRAVAGMSWAWFSIMTGGERPPWVCPMVEAAYVDL